MSAKNDGGPAFPVACFDRFTEDGRKIREQHNGMSLRDYFAGQALVPLLEIASDVAGDSDGVLELLRSTSKMSYAAADAMISAREGKPSKS
jgi:hypothetical protein